MIDTAISNDTDIDTTESINSVLYPYTGNNVRELNMMEFENI